MPTRLLSHTNISARERKTSIQVPTLMALACTHHTRAIHVRSCRCSPNERCTYAQLGMPSHIAQLDLLLGWHVPRCWSSLALLLLPPSPRRKPAAPTPAPASGAARVSHANLCLGRAREEQPQSAWSDNRNCHEAYRRRERSGGDRIWSIY